MNPALAGADMDKARTCLRNVANMAAIRGKLLPLEDEVAARRAAHEAKEDEREARAAAAHEAKWQKKMEAYQKKVAKWEEWERWDALQGAGGAAGAGGGAGAKPRKPRMPAKPKLRARMSEDEKTALTEAWERECDALRAQYEADLQAYQARAARKPRGARPRGPKPTPPEVPDFRAVHRRKPLAGAALKEGPSFSFTFDGTRWTPKLLAKAMGTYGPKLKALLDKIAELDAHDLATHGRLFKHSIYTDTSKFGYGSKIVAAAFIASGYARACHFVHRVRRDEEGRQKRVTVLEPPAPGAPHCKGHVPFTADTFPGRKTFALLASTAVDGHPKDDRRRDATLELFNGRDNDQGQKVRFILLDSGFKEGISLSDVRYAHLLEPPLSQSSLKQAIARSVRRCKSTGLKLYDTPPRGWLVDVFVYRSVFGPGGLGSESGSGSGARHRRTVHDLVMETLGEQAANMRMMDEFENLIMMSAVDYNLNRAILTYQPEGIVDAIERGKAVLNLV